MWKIISGAIIVIAIICATVSQCATSCQHRKLEPIEYIEAVENADYEQAHELLNLHYAEYLDAYRRNPRRISYYAKSYWSAARHIYKAEMQYLLPLNDPDANNRLIYTLQSMNAIGRKPIAGKSYRYDEYPEVDAYADFVAEYNALCNDMLEIAITYNNKDMARRLLNLYKDDVEKQDDKENRYAIHPTSREKAQLKYLAAGYKLSDNIR